MNSQEQEFDPLACARADDVLRGRKVLRMLAGGAVTSFLALAGCTPGIAPPTPTATPSPWVSPTPASSGDVRPDETPPASGAEVQEVRRSLPPVPRQWP